VLVDGVGCLLGGDGAQACGADGPGFPEPFDGGQLGRPPRLMAGSLLLHPLQLALELLLQPAELGERFVRFHLPELLRPRQQILDMGLPLGGGPVQVILQHWRG